MREAVKGLENNKRGWYATREDSLVRYNLELIDSAVQGGRSSSSSSSSSLNHNQLHLFQLEEEQKKYPQMTQDVTKAAQDRHNEINAKTKDCAYLDQRILELTDQITSNNKDLLNEIETLSMVKNNHKKQIAKLTDQATLVFSTKEEIHKTSFIFSIKKVTKNENIIREVSR